MNTAPDYIELPATDVATTKRFYQEAFGWEWTDYGPGYAAAEAHSPQVALNASATVAPPHAVGEQNGVGPLVLLSTNDLDAAEGRVVAAGGSVISPAYGYPGGRRFHFADPSGNVLGVYQPGG